MDNASTERIEIELLLEGIFRKYGYDFRSYSFPSIERRTKQFIERHDIPTISDLTKNVLHRPSVFRDLLPYFFISVTELFRDPFFYKALKEHVYPLLRTWHNLSIWHAGCATGEEAYSNAIFLSEARLYERCTIYGTDMDEAALKTAKDGIYDLGTVKQGQKNYVAAGGAGTLSDYYHSRYNAARISKNLKTNVTFSQHNLATDAQFGTMHMIVCRNVLFYFNNDLRNRVLGVLTDSLTYGGFLCLGDKETLLFSDIEDRFSVVDPVAKIYKKVKP